MRLRTSAAPQQQDDTVCSTASEGVPAWMLSVTATTGSSRQGPTVTIPKNVAKVLLQYLGTALGKSAQENQIPVPNLGSRGKASAWQGMRIPATSVSSQMGEAAAWPQRPQTTSLYMQVPMEKQVSKAQAIQAVDWTNIRKELEKEKDLLQGSGDITMPVTYDARGQNPRWERIDHEVVKDLAKAIRDNGLGSPYFKQLLKGTFYIQT